MVKVSVAPAIASPIVTPENGVTGVSELVSVVPVPVIVGTPMAHSPFGSDSSEQIEYLTAARTVQEGKTQGRRIKLCNIAHLFGNNFIDPQSFNITLNKELITLTPP